MTVAVQVLIGLLTAFIGVLIGLAWRASRYGVTYWRARPFWRPFTSGDLKIVIGRFREFDAFEVSGLVGVGDMQAAVELVSFLRNLDPRRRRSLDIVYHDQLPGDLYDSNLICLGGPDANIVTKRMLKKIDMSVTAGDPKGREITIRDAKTDRVFNPMGDGEVDSRGHEIIKIDYGFLVKAPNPFNSRRSVLIVAGSFGYGTWAGAKLIQSPNFFRAQPISRENAVECIYQTEIIEEIPQAPEIILIRPISSLG